ncbi:MAG: hypothetical protein IPL53_07505 [Ignavibacteria bacterium]|nr:hypothetical protein [Ignavibacteria bacterium]
MEKPNTPLDIIYDWFSGISQIVSDNVALTVMFGTLRSLRNGCYEIPGVNGENEFKKWLMKTEGLELKDIIANILLT